MRGGNISIFLSIVLVEARNLHSVNYGFSLLLCEASVIGEAFVALNSQNFNLYQLIFLKLCQNRSK